MCEDATVTLTVENNVTASLQFQECLFSQNSY